MVRTNEKLHQDLQPHELQILPIRQYSDGRARICPRSIATKNNRYGKRRIAELWANDRTSGIAVQAGRIPELSQLPAGYDCWQLDKPNPRYGQNGNRQATTTEYIVTGHPQGDFPSIAKFYVHFKHIQDRGTEVGCPCDRCVARRRRQASGVAAHNMMAPLSNIFQATQHQVAVHPQAVPQQVQAAQAAQQTVMAPIPNAIATPFFPPQQSAGAIMSGRKRPAHPTYPAPPPAKRLKSGWQEQPSTTGGRSQVNYSNTSLDLIAGLGNRQHIPRLQNQAPHFTGSYANANAPDTLGNPRQHPCSELKSLQSHSTTQHTHKASPGEGQSGATKTESADPMQQHAPYGGASHLNRHHLSKLCY